MIKSKVESDPTVENFEYNENELSILSSDKVGNRSLTTVTKVKKDEYVFKQERTGSRQVYIKAKSLLDFAEIYPLDSKTRKELNKKYK